MPSFDIVSTVDTQEVRNAIDQAQKEIGTRYDFRGSKSSIEFKEKENLIILIGDDQMKMQALQEILRQRLAKRTISLKSVVFEEAKPAGGDTIRQEVKIKMGLETEELKRLNKAIKETKLKVTAQIQGDQLRVTGKKRDDLQDAIQTLRAEISDLELQFINFRE